MSSEGKSIIHQLMRMEKKVAKALASPATFGKPRLSFKRFSFNSSTRSSFNSSSLSCSPSEHSARSIPDLDDDLSTSTSDESATLSLSTEFCRRPSECTVERLPTVSAELSSGEYRTVTQNDIMECLENNQGMRYMIHFHDDSKSSKTFDTHMRVWAELYSDCEFLRLDGRLAPFLARKLSVTKFPTVLFVQNGVVGDRVSSPNEDEELAGETVVLLSRLRN